MLMRQIEICVEEKSMQLRPAKRERVLHSLTLRFFRTLEGSVCQIVLQTSADRVV